MELTTLLNRLAQLASPAVAKRYAAFSRPYFGVSVMALNKLAKELSKELDAADESANRSATQTSNQTSDQSANQSPANQAAEPNQANPTDTHPEKPSHRLALALWETGNYDAMYLAGCLADPQAHWRYLLTWALQAQSYEEKDFIVAVTLAQHQNALGICLGLLKAGKSLSKTTGYAQADLEQLQEVGLRALKWNVQWQKRYSEAELEALRQVIRSVSVLRKLKKTSTVLKDLGTEALLTLASYESSAEVQAMAQAELSPEEQAALVPGKKRRALRC